MMSIMSYWYPKWTDLCCCPAPHSPPAVPPLSCGSFVSNKVRQVSVWLKWQTEHSMVRVGKKRGDGRAVTLYCISLTHQGIYLKFSCCRLTIRKQHFLNSPKTPTPEESLSSPPRLPHSTSGWSWAVWALCHNEHTVNTHFYQLSTQVKWLCHPTSRRHFNYKRGDFTNI